MKNKKKREIEKGNLVEDFDKKKWVGDKTNVYGIWLCEL